MIKNKGKMTIKRKIGIVFGIFAAIILVLWGVIFGIVRYNRWRAEEEIRKTAEALDRFAKEDFNRAMADTFGGKTPQETLDLYIAAVKAGDYELASKYFIGEKQEEELNSLQQSKKENIENVLELLKQTRKFDGGYSSNGDGFLVRKPILVDFKLYPNGIWKIVEI